MNGMDEVLKVLADKGVIISLNTRRSIFKKELLASLSESECKKLRKKVRNIMQDYARVIVATTGKDKKVLELFNNTYRECYATNDYTLASVASDNMKEYAKDLLTKALTYAKKEYGNQKEEEGK